MNGERIAPSIHAIAAPPDVMAQLIEQYVQGRPDLARHAPAFDDHDLAFLGGQMVGSFIEQHRTHAATLTGAWLLVDGDGNRLGWLWLRSDGLAFVQRQ
ncbi:hypothetical protein [Paraburkholderia sp. JHI869]|uniref:hypothetical protein n=1 Tax=Paraburkholderia sp. JHI869 TaxID=3112959 RepID=UPI00317E51D9